MRVSVKNERKSEQAHIPQAPTLLENAVYNEWQALVTGYRQISKFKKGVTPRKKINQNFLWISPSTHYVLHNYKVSRNSVVRFQRSCADKKNRTGGLTDRLTD